MTEALRSANRSGLVVEVPIADITGSHVKDPDIIYTARTGAVEVAHDVSSRGCGESIGGSDGTSILVGDLIRIQN